MIGTNRSIIRYLIGRFISIVILMFYALNSGRRKSFQYDLAIFALLKARFLFYIKNNKSSI